ncbi:putative olfactory ionotropic receptor IR4-like 29, partial [Homarus americanus]
QNSNSLDAGPHTSFVSCTSSYQQVSCRICFANRKVEVMASLTPYLLLLAAIVLQATGKVSLPKGENDALTSAGEVVEAVLAATSHPRCSVFLLTDGTTSSVSNKLVTLPGPWGVGVFEVAVDGQDANITQTQLSRVVDEAR